HELHRWALHGFGNRFGIIEVVLLSLAIGVDIFGRHQPGIVTKRCEFAAQMMCADAGFHADQARRYIGEPRFHLSRRPFLPQHFLPISMPITATLLSRLWDMLCSFVFG